MSSTNSKTTTTNPHSNRNHGPPEIQILLHPYNSPEAKYLIAALDDELFTMYPDWADLPHPNKASVMEQKARDDRAESELDTSNTDDLGSGSNTKSTTTTASPASTSNPTPTPQGFQDIVKVKEEGLLFFVAFEIQPDSSATTTTTTTASLENTTTKNPIACFALRPLPSLPSLPAKPIELKRLYVLPSHRGAKFNPRIASQLLLFAQHYAKTTLGMDCVVLETGYRQHAAVRLYRREGWRERECFGEYVQTSVANGGVSVCFEMGL